MKQVTKAEFDAWKRANSSLDPLSVTMCYPPQTHYYDSNVWGVGKQLARVVWPEVKGGERKYYLEETP